MGRLSRMYILEDVGRSLDMAQREEDMRGRVGCVNTGIGTLSGGLDAHVADELVNLIQLKGHLILGAGLLGTRQGSDISRRHSFEGKRHCFL